MTLLECAKYYLSRGWMPVPVPRGKKKPVSDDWPKLRLTEADLPEHFSNGSNVGLILGEASGGLVDGDLDCDEARDMAPQYLPSTPAKTGRPSAPESHWWYYAEVPRTRQFRDPVTKEMIIELRSTGGQTIVGPSIHPEGEQYSILTGEPARVPGPMLLACVEALYQAVLKKRYPNGVPQPEKKKESPPAATTPSDQSAEMVERRAVAYLDKVPSAISGQGGHATTYVAAVALVHGFCLSPDRALQLLLECYNPRCQPPWTEKELRHKVDDAAAKPHDKPYGWLRDAAPDQDPQDEVDISALLPQKQRDVAKDDRPKDPGLFPERLLDCGGLLAQITEYDNIKSFKRQPELALAAAIALVGVITGRKVRDEFDTRTNVYCLGVCRSGGGKERARLSNKEILFQAGLEKMVGPEGLASHAGLISAVHAQPATLFQLDEIGRLLRTLSNPSKAPHLYHIATVLMRLFTSSNSVYIGDAYADVKRNKAINQPHACLYGSTGPQALFEALTVESLTDGFVSRLLVFETTDHDPEPQKPATSDVPRPVLDVVRWWGDFKPGGNLSSETPQPIIIPYTEAASEVMEQLEHRARAERQKSKNDAVVTVWTRTTEKARKLALIHACSLNHEKPVVDVASATWAAELSEFITRKMLFLAAEWISDGLFDAKQKKLLRAIREAGGKISRSDFYNLTRSLTPRERTELIDNLLETGQVALVSTPTATKTRIEYVLQ